MRIIICLLLFCGCNQQSIINCSVDNYYVSKNTNPNNQFQNKHREIITTFSENELNSLFNNTNISCKEVLTTFFYCNICFNSSSNYLTSYNGNKFEILRESNPSVFTNNVITLIKSMKMGQKEYEKFLNAQKKTSEEGEDKLLKKYFNAENNDSIIQPIKIQTH